MVIGLPENKALLHFFRAAAPVRSSAGGMPEVFAGVMNTPNRNRAANHGLPLPAELSSCRFRSLQRCRARCASGDDLTHL